MHFFFFSSDIILWHSMHKLLTNETCLCAALCRWLLPFVKVFFWFFCQKLLGFLGILFCHKHAPRKPLKMRNRAIAKICLQLITVVCKSVHKFASVWCKTASGEVGVSLPWWCAALVLLAPGYWSLFLNLKNWFIMEKWPEDIFP